VTHEHGKQREGAALWAGPGWGSVVVYRVQTKIQTISNKFKTVQT
jgi:hypothetical protein